jgi:hypothetical protein
MKHGILFGGALALGLLSCVPARAGEPGTRSPVLACGLSILLPAGGQYYNGQVVKGILFDAAYGLGAVMIILNHETDWGTEPSGKAHKPDSTAATIGAGLIAAIWVYSVVDAPVSASLINRRLRQRAGIPGPEDRSAAFEVRPLVVQAPGSSVWAPAAQASLRF